MDLTFTTRNIHNWSLFLLWLSLFSKAISLLLPSSILDAYWLEGLISSFISLCLFILLMGFSRQEYWRTLLFPSPVDHILSELSTWPNRLGWPYTAWWIRVIKLHKASMWSFWLVFCDVVFILEAIGLWFLLLLLWRQWPKPSQRKRNTRKQNGWGGPAVSWEKKRSERQGERQRYAQLNAEFQRIIGRDKKAFLSEQCKEIEEDNRMGTTRDLF